MSYSVDLRNFIKDKESEALIRLNALKPGLKSLSYIQKIVEIRE